MIAGRLISRACSRSGFSLLEVLIAVAVFATAVVAIVGLSAPVQRGVGDTVDAEIATRLAKNIEAELKRIGYSELMQSPLLPRLSPAAETPLRLYATADGSRVLVDVDAEHSLTTGTPPGLAERDRHFLVEVVAQVEPSAAAGWLALRTDLSWPFRVPTGPATSGASSPSEDGSELVPEERRRSKSYFFALTP